jgi:hypothetical protein
VGGRPVWRRFHRHEPSVHILCVAKNPLTRRLSTGRHPGSVPTSDTILAERCQSGDEVVGGGDEDAKSSGGNGWCRIFCDDSRRRLNAETGTGSLGLGHGRGRSGQAKGSLASIPFFSETERNIPRETGSDDDTDRDDDVPVCLRKLAI